MMIYGHLQQPKVKHQQTEQSGSSLNTWFTWKRKSKNNSSSNGTQRPINVHSHHHHHHHHHSQQQQHQHVSEYCPAANGSQSHVPPSLARLFVQPNGRSATTNCTTSPSSTSSKPMCLCSGLTQSTFMAPTYFDDDDDDATNDKDKQHRATSLESSNHLKYKSKTLKSHKSGKSSFEMNGTIRSISTGSLLLTTNGNKNDCSISTKNQQQQQQKRVTRPFNTLNMNRLNQAKSCDQLHSNSSMEYGSFNTTNRKSILECDINPYELIETERKHKTKDKIKCATIAVKSSRNGYRTKREIDDGDEYEDYLDENEDYEQHHHRSISTLNRHGHGRSRIHKGIFQAANSIRIAGQSVYSSIKNDTNHLTYSEYDGSGVGGGGVDKSGKFKSSIDVNQSVNDDRPKMLRCKSSTSLCEWNFDSSTTNTTERTKPKAANFHSILIEPEPDYDMEESEIILDHSKTTDGGTNQSIESSKCDTINRRIRSSSITRPKVNPPPPPEPISLPPPTIAPPPPPPPPPPPSDYFTSSENSSPTISLSTLSSSISTLKPIGSINGKSSNLQPSDSISFQNELKEKLNQGVKSILKKTTTNRIVDESSNDSSNDSLESNVDSSSSSTLTTSSSVENRIQAFEQSTTILNGMEPSMIKPKKHVHFRVKTRNGHLSRSRSTSHIITETIHEEDDEHSYYDDVAIPSSAVNSGIIGTRSFDDVSIVSCSSPTLSTLDRRTIHNDQQQNCSVSDTETRASPNSIKNRNDSNQDCANFVRLCSIQFCALWQRLFSQMIIEKSHN
ncbi:hypothetical protein BLOT_015455 [Blomia tropicalis]|nr:hypothetical protein BLOT_015455 [Blomia tropicalis]